MRLKPIPESYWVLPGRFLAGEYPGLRGNEAQTRRRLLAFLHAGFDTFIDLTGENERPPYFSILSEDAGKIGHQVRHQRFPFPDFQVPPPEKMVAVLDAIDTALAEGRTVYLHCVGGIGRTGMTIGCYLIRHGMKPAQALHHMRELYQSAAQSHFAPQSPESDDQVNFILNWEEHGLA